MIKPNWLLEPVVVALQALVIAKHGGESGVRDHSVLLSALDRPQNKYAYEPGCTVYELAAAYSFALAKNHPFIDGNKRIAFLTAAVFFEINGYQFVAEEAEAAVIFESLASGEISESELAVWFKSNTSST